MQVHLACCCRCGWQAAEPARGVAQSATDRWDWFDCRAICVRSVSSCGLSRLLFELVGGAAHLSSRSASRAGLPGGRKRALRHASRLVAGGLQALQAACRRQRRPRSASRFFPSRSSWAAGSPCCRTLVAAWALAVVGALSMRLRRRVSGVAARWLRRECRRHGTYGKQLPARPINLRINRPVPM